MPRSGTSLMMQMLDAGGIPPLTDGRRVADHHNPLGYFEDERARRLAQDSSWLTEARGKAVKIIYRLLPHLPPTLDYRILFMERDLHEVYDSQQDMLESTNDPAAAQNRERVIQALSRDLDTIKQWLPKQSNIRYLQISYVGLLTDPGTLAANIARFLDGGLNQAAMTAAIDPALYRHRRT
jgi:hypothetical protein